MNADIPPDLPRFKRKAIIRLLGMGRNLTRISVLNLINEFCNNHPDERGVDNIVQACLAQVAQNKDNNDIIALDDDENDFEDVIVLDDAKARVKAKRSYDNDVIILDDTLSPPNKHTSSSSSSSKKNDNVISLLDSEEVTINETNPLNEVLKVFPNAKSSYVKTLLQKNSGNYMEIIWEMAEKGYEKEEMAVKEKKTYDFTSTSWETTALYRREALQELNRNFPFLQSNSLENYFIEKKYHYYPSLVGIESVCELPAVFSIGGVNASNRSLYPKKTLQELRQRLDSKKSCLIANMTVRGESVMEITEEVLKEEVRYILQKKREERKEKEKEETERLLDEQAIKRGEAVECGCCYGDHALDLMVQCSEGHLFCRQCLQHYVEATVFGSGRSSLHCMNTSETCPGFFPTSCLECSLPPKVWLKYSEQLARDAVQQANLTGMTNCVHCSLSVQVSENMSVLNCPQCGKLTCLLCNEPAHIPLKCNEVEKEADTEQRKKIEEALTAARVRECPKCKTRFYKTEGCNKMTCACGLLMCYVCRKVITKEGYQHFCQTPLCNHSTCKKCKLFTNSNEDDRLAMLEAGLKTMKEGQQGQGQGQGQEEEVVVASATGGLQGAGAGGAGGQGQGGELARLSEKEREVLNKLIEGGIPLPGQRAPDMPIGARVANNPRLIVPNVRLQRMELGAMRMVPAMGRKRRRGRGYE